MLVALGKNNPGIHQRDLSPQQAFFLAVKPINDKV